MARDQPRIWLTWHHAQRSRGLAAALDLRLCELFIDGGALRRHGASALWTLWILLRHRPGVICLQYSFLLLVLGALYKRLAPWTVRLVADCHTKALLRNVEGMWGRLFWVLKRWSFGAVDLGIVTNEGLRADLETLTPHVLILTDPVPDFGAPDATSAPGEYVAFVCSYAIDEPVEEVIAAAALLAGEIEVVCTGKIPAQLGTLRAQPHPNIHFTDFLSDEAFVDLLRGSACVLALTTQPDCLMSAGYEAIAAGVPPVVSDTAALRAYFEDGAVFVKHHPPTIADGIREAVARRNELIATMSRVRRARQADYETALARLRQVIDG